MGLVDTPRDLHASTAGVPLPGLELKTVDARGDGLPDGSDGELTMRGPVFPSATSGSRSSTGRL